MGRLNLGGVTPVNPPLHIISNIFSKLSCKHTKLCGVVALTYCNLLRPWVPRRSHGTRSSRLTKIINFEFFCFFLGFFSDQCWRVKILKFWASSFYVLQASKLLFNDFKRLEQTLFLLFWLLQPKNFIPFGPQIEIENKLTKILNNCQHHDSKPHIYEKKTRW